jgi:hypothetical protein
MNAIECSGLGVYDVDSNCATGVCGNIAQSATGTTPNIHGWAASPRRQNRDIAWPYWRQAGRGWGKNSSIADQRELATGERQLSTHPDSAWRRLSVPEHVNFDGAIPTVGVPEGVERAGVAPAGRHGVLNLITGQTNRHHLELGEWKRLVIKSKVLNNQICAIGENEARHQQVCEVQIGALKINGQVLQ